MIKLWAHCYPADVGPIRWGDDDVTYELAAQWLDRPYWRIEDWGGGTGWLQRFLHQAYYKVIDGSVEPFVDLREYRSRVDGIVLRHVLEHNFDWAKILENAGRSCHHLLVILFTPLSETETTQIATNWRDIPDLSFTLNALTSVALQTGHTLRTIEHYETKTQYRQEHVLYFVKSTTQRETT